MRPATRRRPAAPLWPVVAALLVPAAPLAAQETVEEEEYATIRWWHPLAAGGAIATLFLLDEPVQEFMQDNQTDFQSDLADIAKEFHAPEVFLVGSVGAMSLGLVAHEYGLAETGVQILASYGLSSGMMITTKWAFGRSRPSETPDDVTNFDAFGGGASSSFPSGAAAVTFALATTLADAIERTPVTIVLYSAAALNSWSRMYTDRHWLSDVALGALYGVTAAKLVNGRWRVFGLEPPTVGVAPDGSMLVGFRVAR
ncbi:MAG: phosphatase PAP2 family protein [Gemmatimonadales bacterium]